MSELTLRPIGVIRSPHQRPEHTPIQPVFAEGVKGTVEVDPAFEEGLADLDGFSHIWLIYWLDRAGKGRPHRAAVSGGRTPRRLRHASAAPPESDRNEPGATRAS